LKHIMAEKKLEYELYVKAQKEKEKDSKNLKKLELQLKACQDSLINITQKYEKINAQVDPNCVYKRSLPKKISNLIFLSEPSILYTILP
jgi:predicted  nucleic acid-binding Zn-ribbon protein